MILDHWRARLRGIFRRNWAAQEVDEELRYHVERQTELHAASGMSPEDARRRAMIEFGGLSLVKEECRDALGTRLVEAFLQDLRFALRMLRKNPGFTALAVLTLALGIGANTAVFSAVDRLLVRPLPYFEADRLVSIHLTYLPTQGYRAFQERSRTVDLAAFDLPGLNLTGHGEAVRLNASGVSPNFFSVLGVGPMRGRTFEDGETLPGRNRVVVLSHAFWQTRLAGDPSIVGKSIELDGAGYEVVGIMPPDFHFPNSGVEVWIPLRYADPDLWGRWVQMFGRLRPGVTVEQARSEIKALVPQVTKLFPWAMPEGWGSWADVIPTQKQLIGNLRTKLLLLFGAVGLVLLIACANVANLLLARAASRQREIAVRIALGAGRGRILRQLATESVLLAGIGGGAGLLLAPAGMALVRRLIPLKDLPNAEIGVDARVLVFSAVVAVLTGIVFGLAPALRARKLDVEEALKSSGRSSLSRERRRASSSLVVIETALAVVLTVAAGLLVRSLWQITHQAAGFDPRAVITASLTPSRAMCAPGYGDLRVRETANCSAFYDAVLARAAALPGVESASYAAVLPYRDLQNTVIAVENNPHYAETSPYQLMVYIISPEYFRTMGIPLLAGRTFNQQDMPKAPGVVILSRNAAARLWPGESPIGKRVKPSWMKEWRTVVGVVDEVRGFAVSPNPAAFDPASGAVYYPVSQGIVAPPTELALVLRTPNPGAVASSIPAAVAAVNATVPVTAILTMQQIMDDSISDSRAVAWLFAALAGLALLLGAVGLYSLMSYTVTSQTQEIGIRMALGAQPGAVRGRVLIASLKLASFGVLAGLAASLALTRLLRSQLYGIRPTDPVTFAAVALTLVLVAMAAAYVPAHRASSVDPTKALRYD
jgi:predicted permease